MSPVFSDGRDPLGERRAGEPDPRPQLEHVDRAEGLAEQPHLAAGRVHLRGGQLQQRRLPRPVRAEHHPAVVGLDGPVHAAQEVGLPPHDVDPGHPDDRPEGGCARHGPHPTKPAGRSCAPTRPGLGTIAVCEPTTAAARTTGRRGPARLPLPPRRPLGRHRHQLRAVVGRGAGGGPLPVRRRRHRAPAPARGDDPPGLARPAARASARASATATGCTAPTTRSPASGTTRPSCCSTPTRGRSTATLTLHPSLFGYAGDSVDSAARDDQDSAPYVPRGVVVHDPFPWDGDRPLRTSWSDTVIYEVHVKGATARAPRRARRTCAAPTPGLAHPAFVEHLQSLGVTAVELLPVHHFVSEPHLLRRGLTNYWGYNTLGYFAPHAAYSSSGSGGGQVTEFKTMVKELHAAGIEVILDVVYNHTAEGDHTGPTLSFKGIDNPGYYRLDGEQPRPVHRLHRLREHPRRPPSRGAGAAHGLAALLGHRDARRRVPLRPRLGAGPLDARRRPAVGLLRRRPPGPGGQQRQADRRAVGRRPRRLPGRQLPAAVDGVERQVPRHRARRLVRRARRRPRPRLPADRLLRPLPLRRPAPVRQHQLRHRARRLHAGRPGHLRAQAQRGQRRGQPGRREPQPQLELRRRGPDRRPGGPGAAGPAGAQPPGHAAAVHRRADADRRRRARPHPAGQQQRLLPGQRDLLARLEGRRRGPAARSSPG